MLAHPPLYKLFFVFRERITAKIPLFTETPKPFVENVYLNRLFFDLICFFERKRTTRVYIIMCEDSRTSLFRSCPYSLPVSMGVCVHKKYWFLHVCVHKPWYKSTKQRFFIIFSLIILFTPWKARNFASSKGKKEITSEWHKKKSWDTLRKQIG